MDEERYERTIEELETHACKWWPKEIQDKAEENSVLQTLLDSQENFISILKLADKNNPNGIFELIEAARFPFNMFLKHLMVLTDFGAERVQRINKNFQDLFPNNKFTYNTGNEDKEYCFLKLPVRGPLTNAKMKIDNVQNLTSYHEDKDLYKDLIIILLYGSASTNARVRAVLFKCSIYEFLGNDTEIDEFVKQNYIRVSKIISGKTATDLGNVAQEYAVECLSDALGENYNVKSNGTIPDVTQNDGVSLTNFDIVVDRVDDNSRHKKYVAVEVTFQETTNSTIERKGGQARDRFEKITSSRNYIAYIIDGAGNFVRKSAVRTLCDNSHCTVAYTPEEFQLLVEFIEEKIG